MTLGSELTVGWSWLTVNESLQGAGGSIPSTPTFEEHLILLTTRSRFESHSEVAQLVEQAPVKRKVDRSNRSPGAQFWSWSVKDARHPVTVLERVRVPSRPQRQLLPHGGPNPFGRLSGIRGLAHYAALRSLNTQPRRMWLERRLLRGASFLLSGFVAQLVRASL
jgi:hypothetical protein